VDRHITPTKVPSFNQSKLHFHNAMLIQQSPALALVIASTDKEDGSKELLIDKLIGKAATHLW
jgi:hypothetical protein